MRLVLLRIFNLLTLRISDAVIVVTVAVSVVFLFSVSFIIAGVIVIIASVIMSPPIGKGGAISIAFVCPSVCPDVRRIHSE